MIAPSCMRNMSTPDAEVEDFQYLEDDQSSEGYQDKECETDSSDSSQYENGGSEDDSGDEERSEDGSDDDDEVLDMVLDHDMEQMNQPSKSTCSTLFFTPLSL